MREMVGGCCVCSDERGWDENPLVYCDGQGCNVAVHQACYGIVTVPSGPWFCRKCESTERSARVRCELCPCRDGALKRTDQNSWAHVVCALYIPEVRFGNVTTMEPILISLIPSERFHKSCYICEDNNRGTKTSFGACMQCNKPGCKQNFHVTCAQLLGLLCEEAGNMMDNVKYCGYCQYHYSKLKKTSNMKIIPPFRPAPPNNPSVESPSSSPEKSTTPQKSFSSTSNDDAKNPTGSASASTQLHNNEKNSSSSGDSGKGNNSISPDINHSNNSSKNAKSSKKSGSSHHSTSSKSSGPGSSDNKSNPTSSTIPRISIAPSNLFSSSAFASSLNKHSSSNKDNTTPDDSSSVKSESTKTKASTCKTDDNKLDSLGLKTEDTPLKLEKSDSGGSAKITSIIQKKDFSTLQLKEVVAAALDRPMTSVGSKFDHSSSSSLIGGIDPPTSSRHSLGDKPAPPDIKPHVTLTPIPMRSSRLSASKEDLEEREKEKSRKSKSPVSAHAFPTSFGQPPKLQNQNMSPDMAEVAVSKGKSGPPDLSFQGDVPLQEKSAPPAKRSRIEIEEFGDNSAENVETWTGREEDEGSESMSRSGSMTRSAHLSRKDAFHSTSHHLLGQGQVVVPGQSTPINRMLTQAQSHEMSLWESSKQGKPGNEMDILEDRFGDLKPLKRGPGRPPRRTGPSREDDRVSERKPPGKPRGGRRGAAASVPAYPRRETRDSLNNLNNTNGAATFIDESSFDDPLDVSSVAPTARGGRHSGPGRKPPTVRNTRPEDPPAPTLSQLKQMQQSGDQQSGSGLPAHMFGNALNPASSMAQRMVDTLSQEIEASAAAGEVPEVISPQPQLVGIPFPGKVGHATLLAGTSSISPSPTPVAIHTPNNLSGRSITTSENANGNTNTPIGSQPVAPQTLEQLLERQWEQGSQFLMEQAQHLDIAQLLSCLNQLKSDNKALEEHVQSLSQRRDQLTAINARLSVPLGSSSTLVSAGAGFNQNSSHNGHGHQTPPPTLQQQQPHPHNKNNSTMQVQIPVPSPQQQHEMMIQGRMSGSGGYPHPSDVTVSRGTELSMVHQTHSPHAHTMHTVHGHGHSGGHRSQAMNSPYASFTGHGGSHGPAPTTSHSHPSPHSSHHPMPRDSR